MQVNINPNPTKEQLIHGVQNHLLSQVHIESNCCIFCAQSASLSDLFSLIQPPHLRTATGRDAGYRRIHPHRQEIENPLLVEGTRR